MKIKIDIIGDISEGRIKPSKLQLNQFEEVVLFLDCPNVQSLIKTFRDRIHTTILTNSRDATPWKARKISPTDDLETLRKSVVFEFELDEEETHKLFNLNSMIDSLENRPYNILNQDEQYELDNKIKERDMYLNPYEMFLYTLRKKLNLIGQEKFYPILIKAILIGRINDEDWTRLQTNHKGARKSIFDHRKWYWQYQQFRAEKSSHKGYGSTGTMFNVLLRTTISGVNAYEKMINKFNTALPSSII